MLAVDRVAEDAGWTAIWLRVFGSDPRARALHDSLGHEVASTATTKPLTG